MKRIPLTQGKYAIVDDGDYEELAKYKWHFLRYARRTVQHNNKKQCVFMHRVINKTPKGLETDHINGNTLDNRRCNLRTCTASENKHNQTKHVNNKSGYKGVSYIKCGWRAQIKVSRKIMYLGSFASPEEAYEAYKLAAIKYHKEFARQ